MSFCGDCLDFCPDYVKVTEFGDGGPEVKFHPQHITVRCKPPTRLGTAAVNFERLPGIVFTLLLYCKTTSFPLFHTVFTGRKSLHTIYIYRPGIASEIFVWKEEAGVTFSCWVRRAPSEVLSSCWFSSWGTLHPSCGVDSKRSSSWALLPQVKGALCPAAASSGLAAQISIVSSLNSFKNNSVSSLLLKSKRYVTCYFSLAGRGREMVLKEEFR